VSDHRERACTFCGSYLHHEDDCEKKLRRVEGTTMSKLITGSCLDPKRGLPSMKANSVDHIITDPPYEEYTHENRMGLRKVDGKGKAEPIDVQMGFAFITQAERVAVAREMVRVSKGWILVFCEDYAIGAWVDALVAGGAKRKTTMPWVALMWEKTNAAPRFDGSGPAQPAEYIVAAWAGRGRSTWNAGGKRGLYRFPTPPAEGRRHATQKPLVLMQQLVLDFTKPGQLVCDPYAGGGTTLVAAKTLGRAYLGWEVDAEPAEAARHVLSKTREQLHLERVLQRVKPSGQRNPSPRRAKEEQLGFDV